MVLEFPVKGKKLPVRKATNCSLQSAAASEANRLAGRVTEAKATEFWRIKKGVSHTRSQTANVDCIKILH